MIEPTDPVDVWLDAEIKPLAPPTGAYEQVRLRARRRKTRQLLGSAAGLAIVVAAAVTGPGIVSGLSGHTSPAGHASTGRGTSIRGNQDTPSPGSTQVTPPASTLANGSDAVPANFQPTSVTFVGPDTGAVIGQAGTPGQCATSYCTSLAGTLNYGTSWHGVNAPLAGPPDGPAGVGQLRFLTLRDGWAFGPALWVTLDGGAHWAQESTFGLRVTDLETAGNRAFALLANCTGSGSNYAADCTGFSLYSSAAGTSQWTQVPGPTASLASGGQPGSAGLVLAGGRGYLLAPSGELLSGPLTGGSWTVADSSVPCQPGAPGPDGQPSAALLAADSSGLALICTTAAQGTSSQPNSIYESSDGGATWSPAGNAPASATPAALAAQPGGLLLLATSAGIYRSGNGGSTWQLAGQDPAGAAAGESGFSYVGMTSDSNGVALPADPGLHEVFTTGDGGQTWQSRQVSAP
jgi:hypothetical protein